MADYEYGLLGLLELKCTQQLVGYYLINERYIFQFLFKLPQGMQSTHKRCHSVVFSLCFLLLKLKLKHK
jgi:hypothetical protein